MTRPPRGDIGGFYTQGNGQFYYSNLYIFSHVLIGRKYRPACIYRQDTAYPKTVSLTYDITKKLHFPFTGRSLSYGNAGF